MTGSKPLDGGSLIVDTPEVHRRRREMITHSPPYRRTAIPPTVGPMEIAHVQRRTLRLLFVTQIISGVGVAVGASVGALLAADIAGVSMSGLAQSAAVIGSALFAVPATTIVNDHGRRPSLALLYLIAAAGAITVLVAAKQGSIPLL